MIVYQLLYSTLVRAFSKRCLFYCTFYPDIDTGKLAQSTTGCTGADIENIVNQAALKAVLDGAKIVTKEHFEYARDKVFMGELWLLSPCN